MRKFGLIGKNIDYSFSRDFFTEKFKNEGIEASYQNFDISSINEFKKVLQKNPDLEGLNVTTPYKKEIMPFLDELHQEAQKIGAVNTIQFKNGKLIGHNTDSFGFVKSIFPLIENHHEKALLLGTGGASLAVEAGLKSMRIEVQKVSRKKSDFHITYDDLTEKKIQNYHLIINATPVGTHPNERECPDIPYKYLTKNHFLFDLVYNPSFTKFLALGKQRGAKIYNGQKMLEYQALRAWNIWND
ncbi:MAG: shikimate dehydrogenase family protein [Bacteroidota bacterium]